MIEQRVIDALELARNRLHEPVVKNAYLDLVELVNHQLGGQIVTTDSSGVLTEPQLVLIGYGLKHVRGAAGGPLLRATERLIGALSGEELNRPLDATASGLPPYLQDLEPAPSVPEQSPPQAQQAEAAALPAELPIAPRPTTVTRIRQRLGNITGGNVTVIGQQNNHAPPPPPLVVEDEGDEDTSEIAAVVDEAAAAIYDVFLSYSRKNAEQMRRVRADLRAAGLHVWTDENLNIGTPSWKRAVEGAIRTSRSLVILMTPESKASVWVERELNAATTLNKPIFPLLVRGKEKDSVPFMLNSAQYLDIRREQNYRDSLQKLIKAIKAGTRQRKA
jgi:TIR domain